MRRTMAMQDSTRRTIAQTGIPSSALLRPTSGRVTLVEEELVTVTGSIVFWLVVDVCVVFVGLVVGILGLLVVFLVVVGLAVVVVVVDSLGVVVVVCDGVVVVISLVIVCFMLVV